MLGDKEEGERRGGLLFFFEGERICAPPAAPPCASCVISDKAFYL